jgi:hypothetical protein
VTFSLRLAVLIVVIAALAGCSGQPGQPSAGAPTSVPATSTTPTAECAVSVEPEVAAPGGWSVVIGRGFAPGEAVSWSQSAEDGSLEAAWDTEGFEPLRPDARGGFGFGLGSAGPEAVGHTISATITSASCTAHASWRIEAANEQTAPLPATSPAACVTSRTSVERVDDLAEHQVHLIYALPSDARDLELDRNGQIAASLGHVDRYLRERLDGSAFRLDTCDGNIDVTFLRLARTSAEYAAMRSGFLQGLELDLARDGFRYGRKLYVVVWGGLANWARLDDGCGGDAGFHGVAVAYLWATNGDACPAIGVELPIGEPDTGLAHEIVHLLGLPAACGANVDDGGHVADDPSDLMYGRGHTTAEVIDAGHDDYYRHGVAGCPDLANSAFLDPLPANPELPAGWPDS